MSRVNLAEAYELIKSEIGSKHNFLKFVKSCEVPLLVSVDGKKRICSKNDIVTTLKTVDGQKLFFKFISTNGVEDDLNFGIYPISILYYDYNLISGYFSRKEYFEKIDGFQSLDIKTYIKPIDESYFTYELLMPGKTMQKNFSFRHRSNADLLEFLVEFFHKDRHGAVSIDQLAKRFEIHVSSSRKPQIRQIFDNIHLAKYFRQVNRYIYFVHPNDQKTKRRKKKSVDNKNR